MQQEIRKCRVCGCTDDDCSGCIERTGERCYWVSENLCSACVEITGNEGWPPDGELGDFIDD